MQHAFEAQRKGAEWRAPQEFIEWAGAVFVDLYERDTPVRNDGERRWYMSDHETLATAMDYETYLRQDSLPAETPSEVRAEINGHVDDWHAALPFDEVEREIVRSAYTHPSARGVRVYLEVPGRIRQQQFEVVSGGLRRVVKGRELMRRWWSWRREADEFEGQGSLDQARTAITGLLARLTPAAEMPNDYWEIRGLPVPEGHRSEAD